MQLLHSDTHSGHGHGTAEFVLLNATLCAGNRPAAAWTFDSSTTHVHTLVVVWQIVEVDGITTNRVAHFFPVLCSWHNVYDSNAGRCNDSRRAGVERDMHASGAVSKVAQAQAGTIYCAGAHAKSRACQHA